MLTNHNRNKRNYLKNLGETRIRCKCDETKLVVICPCSTDVDKNSTDVKILQFMNTLSDVASVCLPKILIFFLLSRYLCTNKLLLDQQSFKERLLDFPKRRND